MDGAIVRDPARYVTNEPCCAHFHARVGIVLVSECGSTLYIGMRWKQNGHPYNLIIPEHTNKQDLTFKNCPEVVSDDFLGDLCIFCCQIILISGKPANGQVAGFHPAPRALMVGLFASILAKLNCAIYKAGNSYL